MWLTSWCQPRAPRRRAVRRAVQLAPDRADYHYFLGEVNADLAAAVTDASGDGVASKYYKRATDAYWATLSVDHNHSDAFFSLLWFQLYLHALAVALFCIRGNDWDVF